MTANRPAVVLLSGGLDSTTVLAHAQHAGYDCHALSFRYGQRHAIELDAAAHVAATYRVTQHVVVNIDLTVFGGSALTDPTIPVPHNSLSEDIPVTYVPARNTIFLSYALAYAETIGAADLFIGVNALDYSGYPDCRPEYIAAFQNMANLATVAGITGRQLTIHAPLIAMSKADIIRRGLRLGVNYSQTHSCYDPAGTTPCGTCDSCQLRIGGFIELGLTDPVMGR